MKKIVTIGGGTGTFAVLSGLKKYSVELSAIVTMADDGGSSGVLRDEYGVLPPGDVRQSLIALSESDALMRRLITHRYAKGGLAGHNFGNILISTLEQISGSLEKALDVVGKILNIRGRVIPVTFSKVKLHVELQNGKVIRGEDALRNYQLVSKFGIKKMYLSPKAKANPNAVKAIREADVIVVGPGHLYGSLAPNFLVPGIGKALIASKAKKIYIANLMNRFGHTDDFSVADYVHFLEDIIGQRGVFDVVIYNTERPHAALLARYADEGEMVPPPPAGALGRCKSIGTDLLASRTPKAKKGDLLASQRALIRHDQTKLARIIAAQ